MQNCIWQFASARHELTVPGIGGAAGAMRSLVGTVGSAPTHSQVILVGGVITVNSDINCSGGNSTGIAGGNIFLMSSFAATKHEGLTDPGGTGTPGVVTVNGNVL